MNSNAFGELFKYIRTEKKISQAELSYGICTPRTIYNIEKGKNTPSSSLMLHLANKLDINLLSILSFSNSPNGLINYKRFERCRVLYENNSFFELNRETDALLSSAKEFNAYQLQTLYWYKGIYLGAQKKDLPEAKKCFKTALSYTKDMPIEKMAHHYCSQQELHILNSFAATLIKQERFYEAECFFSQLIENIERFGPESKGNLFLKICYNLAKCQNKQKKPSQSLSTCKKGIEVAQKNNLLSPLSQLYLELANSYDHLSQIEMRNNCLKRFIYLHEICGNSHLVSEKKATFSQNYEISFDEMECGLEELTRGL